MNCIIRGNKALRTPGGLWHTFGGGGQVENHWCKILVQSQLEPDRCNLCLFSLWGRYIPRHTVPTSQKHCRGKLESIGAVRLQQSALHKRKHTAEKAVFCHDLSSPLVEDVKMFAESPERTKPVRKLDLSIFIWFTCVEEYIMDWLFMPSHPISANLPQLFCSCCFFRTTSMYCLYNYM